MNDLTETDSTAGALVSINDSELVSLAEQAERRIDAIQKIKRIAIKLTSRFDWVDQNGRPYLQASGAEKIARMFGISWRIEEPSLEYDPDGSGHYIYAYKGIFSIKGESIEAVGTRSSKDGFFKKYGKDAEGNKITLGVSEIDRGDVKKAAYTNCIGNGITRLLGIRGLTYEDLEAFAGIRKADIGAVEYKQKNGTASKEGLGEVDVIPHLIDVKKGTSKAGKEFTQYIIRDAEGNEYKTFSDGLMKLAKNAMEGGTPIHIVFNRGKYGCDIENIEV